jgi:protoporphyrinogen IX oxidase
MVYFYIKALHIIFVVTWFAGLFYMPRLLIYHIEASEKPEPAKSILISQFKIMQKRLWFGITWPSMILTTIFGFWSAYNINCWTSPWFILKLSFVLGLVLYHLSLHVIFKQLAKDIIKYSSTQLRIWNEAATLFLISIVFIVVLKDTISFLWGIIGLLIITLFILSGMKIYKNIREKNKTDK